MILNDFVMTTVVPRTAKTWAALGYQVPENLPRDGAPLRVKVGDLPDGSNIEVRCRCDQCGEEYRQRYCRDTAICGDCRVRDRMIGNTFGSQRKKYPTPPKDELIDLHHNQRLGRREIARHFKVTGPVVERWFREHEIAYLRREERRPSKEELINLHHNQQMRIRDIATHYTKATVIIRRWLDEYGIEQQYHRGPRIEVPSKEDLVDLHINQRKTFKEISLIYDVSDVQVGNWYRDYGIDNRLYLNGGPSQGEGDLRDFLNAQGYNFIKTRSVIKGELDLYDGQHRLAIEYCGLWWHREDTVGRSFHLNKLKACQDKRVRLLTVFEDEWLTRQEIVKSLILSRLGSYGRTVPARACDVWVNHPEEVASFLQENHLQGKPTNIHLDVSLRYQDEIVATMTLGHHHRQNMKGLILNRLCFAKDTAVVGGTDRIFKHLRKHYSGPIVTWADRRWSEGEVYKRLGFMKADVTGPDYVYAKGQKRRSKQSMMKSNTGCPPEMTEREWCLSQGWYRVYDCGKIKWVHE
jgi:transposase-like protein